MEFQSLFQQFLSGGGTHQASTYRSLVLFLPELILCGSIVAMLLARLTSLDKIVPTHWFALLGSLGAFVSVLFQFWELSIDGQAGTLLFTGLAIHDVFSVFFRGLLLFFLVFVIALTVLSGIPDQEDAPDFYTLLCGAAVGMMVMSSANHLLMLFLGIEMASVPSYAITGFLKGRRQSSEASLKFVVYGAGAAGVMLFGISLLAGLTGTAEFGELGNRLQMIFASGGFGVSHSAARITVLAMLMITVGFAFKLSLVPFHFWCPDAFQGASAEVAGFLSVASKAAAFALLVRFSIAVTGNDAAVVQGLALMMGLGLGAMAIVTTTFGNLAAYSQTNAKRLLAYSTIAHAGYMLMAVSALLVLRSTIGSDAAAGSDQMSRAIEGLLYYLAVYMFMNLGAFAIVALIRNQTFSEEIEDYKGLIHQSPLLAVCMAICLFSLVGLPPLGGFYGKFFIFAAVFDAASVHWFMWVVLAFGGLNTVLSLFYYLRIAKVMCLESRPADARPVSLTSGSPSGMYVMLVTGMVLLLGVIIEPLSRVARHAAAAFFY
jgi:NADH-quinone oxidoreductase subunit N